MGKGVYPVPLRLYVPIDESAGSNTMDVDGSAHAAADSGRLGMRTCLMEPGPVVDAAATAALRRKRAD